MALPSRTWEALPLGEGDPRDAEGVEKRRGVPVVDPLPPALVGETLALPSTVTVAPPSKGEKVGVAVPPIVEGDAAPEGVLPPDTLLMGVEVEEWVLEGVGCARVGVPPPASEGVLMKEGVDVAVVLAVTRSGEGVEPGDPEGTPVEVAHWVDLPEAVAALGEGVEESVPPPPKLGVCAEEAVGFRAVGDTVGSPLKDPLLEGVKAGGDWEPPPLALAMGDAVAHPVPVALPLDDSVKGEEAEAEAVGVAVRVGLELGVALEDVEGQGVEEAESVG